MISSAAAYADWCQEEFYEDLWTGIFLFGPLAAAIYWPFFLVPLLPIWFAIWCWKEYRAVLTGRRVP